MTQGTVEHKAGLEFLRPSNPHFEGLGDKTCWGKLLSNPQFTDLAGLQMAMQGLDQVTTEPVYINRGMVDGKYTMKAVPGRMAVVSKRTGKVYEVLSRSYEPVQDAEVVQPFVKAAESRGLNPVGRIDDEGRRGTSGHILLANPEFRVTLLEDYDEDVMLGVRWWNSYAGNRSFGAEVFGVRTVCINYNLWGHLVGQFRQVHMGSEETMMHRYETLLDKALNASSVLQGVLEEAMEIEVEAKRVDDLLWAITRWPGPVEELGSNLARFNPDVDKVGLNAWTLYNGVTAYLTYREDSGTHVKATQDLARKATDLLTVEHDRLIERGARRKEWYEDWREERRQRRHQRKKATAKEASA